MDWFLYDNGPRHERDNGNLLRKKSISRRFFVAIIEMTYLTRQKYMLIVANKGRQTENLFIDKGS